MLLLKVRKLPAQGHRLNGRAVLCDVSGRARTGELVGCLGPSGGACKLSVQGWSGMRTREAGSKTAPSWLDPHS